MGQKITLAIAIFILAYYAFVSGLVYELTGNVQAGFMNIPYSIALSNERTKIVGIFTQGDIEGARWLVYETPPNIPILTDYLGASLILDLSDAGRNTYNVPSKPYYIFLTSHNTKTQQMVFGWYGGLRQYKPLPSLDGAVKVFNLGDTQVYIIKGVE